MAKRRLPATRPVHKKAISIRQPYADLVLAGKKKIEYRQVRSKHSGPLLIHASSTVYWDDVGRHRRFLKTERDGTYSPITKCIIGEVFMYKVKETPRSRRRNGKFSYFLRSPKRYKRPIPCNGWLGIWPVTPERLRKKKVSKGK